MTPTPEQAAIFSHMRDTTESLIVEALAGSGKTTTLVGIAREAPEPSGLALAFNKHAKEDLERKMPSHWVCKTMNGLGHSILGRHLGGRVTLNTRKVGDTLTQLASEGEIEPRFAEGAPRFEMIKALSIARMWGLGVSDVKWPQLPLLKDTSNVWLDIFDNYEISLPPDAIPALRTTLRAMAIRLFYREADFDDQIWGPVVFRMAFPRYPLVLVDEAQDLSPIQHIMVERATKGRVVAVGDRRQAIYGFRGASHTSMDELRTRFNAQELPLSICFRCDASIVEEARQLAPQMRPRPDAPEGSVNVLDEWGPETLRSTEGRIAILCRNNAPLFRLAYRVMAKGFGVEMKGSDIGKAMIQTLKKNTPGVSRSAPTASVLGMLGTWRNQEVEKAERTDKPWIAQRANDRFESFVAISEHVETLGEMFDEIERLFSPKASKIVLSSIHKSKGLEFPNVFFLDRDLIPSRYAKSPDALQQENNLLYVGITRAQHHLTYLTAEGWNEDQLQTKGQTDG